MDRESYGYNIQQGVYLNVIRMELDKITNEEYWPKQILEKLCGSASKVFWNMHLIIQRLRTYLSINYWNYYIYFK